MSKFYAKSFDCDPADPVQQILNTTYLYKDQQTKCMHRIRLNLFYDTMNELIAKGVINKFNSAIDIGSNAGYYSKLLSDFGFKKVYGIDIDDHLVKIAQQHFACQEKGREIFFEVKNAELLENTSEFDFVLCTEVIEHTGNSSKVIENIVKILKPGGVALITLPNAFSLPYLLTFLSYKLQGRKINKELSDHLSYPFYRSKKLFNDSGLKVYKTTGTNLFYWYFMHKLPFFRIRNKINYYLAKTNLLKNFAQFYFIVLVKPEANTLK